jgi:E3 ubiquitin-protein ligase UBR7
VLKFDTLKRWAGIKGIMMVVRDNASSPWKILDGSGDDDDEEGDVDLADETTSTTAGTKRPLALSAVDVPEAKRPRPCGVGMSTAYLAPPPNVVAQNILAHCNSVNKDGSLGTGDVFLTEGWRERWCRCKLVSSATTRLFIYFMPCFSQCLLSLEANTFLLEEEETYEPPKDPDSGENASSSECASSFMEFPLTRLVA